MELRFDFLYFDTFASNYTVLLSARDADTLGSATESTPSPTDSNYRLFVASNYIDEYDGDDFEPDPPCLRDVVIVRGPTGEASVLFEPGYCLDPSWCETIPGPIDPSPSATATP